MNNRIFSSKVLSEKGMTLVEILAVVVLIALIMGVVVKGITGKGDAAKAQLNVAKMEKVKQALSLYRMQFNSYPNSLDGLMTPSGDIKSSGQLFTPFIEEDEMNDIFGFPFVYKTEGNGRAYTLTSLGSDGLQGGDGAKQDITIRP